MTVFRREDVQSRVASWDERPYRMSSSPIVAIVPRSSAVFPVRPRLALAVDLLLLTTCYALADSGWSAAHRKPASSRAIATAIFGAGLW
jgi:hypothetical protein